MINLLTFGGPTQNFYDAVYRLKEQALEFNMFHNLFMYTDLDLKDDCEFWCQHGEFIENHPRGYGYWIWKPYLIKKTLEKLNDGDVLVYLDCGCELNVRAKAKMEALIATAMQKNIIGTITTSNDITYTKADLLQFMNYNMLDRRLTLPHMQAGCLIMIKNDIIVSLINQWYDICCQDYHFITDSPSLTRNHDTFIEHRHDQSVFNLLVKKYNLINYDIPLDSDPNLLPIWYSRNKTGKRNC
jgi:hypothetical protein